MQQAFVEAGINETVVMSSSVSLLSARFSHQAVIEAVERFVPGSRRAVSSALLSEKRQRNVKAGGLLTLALALLLGAINPLLKLQVLSLLELSLIATGLPLMFLARRMRVISLKTVADVLEWLEFRADTSKQVK